YEQKLFGLGDADQTNRPVSRNPVAPQAGLPLAIGREHGSRRAKSRSCEPETCRQALVKVGFLGGNLQMPQIHLAVSPSQVESAGDCMNLTEMIRKSQRL